MSRPIKFRIWDLENGEWVTGPCEYCQLEKIFSPNKGKWYENTWVFQQFTGLLDKSGKEIYEGDIISIDVGSPIRNDYLKTPSYKKIEYSISIGGDYPFAGFTIININPSDLDTGVLLDCMNCQFSQIVGNIRENPALL